MKLPFHTPLSANQQCSFGIDTPAPFALADKVRFGEIDLLGHVNNTAYLTWFETVRTRYIQAYGLTNYDPKNDPRIVIRSAEIHYIKEMLRDEIYVATARSNAFRTTSFTVAQEVWASDIRARFTCVLVALTPDGSARQPLPRAFTDRLMEIDGASPP